MLESTATRTILAIRIIKQLLSIGVTGKTRPMNHPAHRLSHVHSAGDVDGFAGKVRAVVAGQKGDHSSNVVGRACAAHRDRLDDLLEGLSRRIPLMEVCLSDERPSHRADPDAARG